MGCDPCVPAAPFTEFMNNCAQAEPSSSAEPNEVRPEWPHVIGEYTVGDRDAAVAVCSLSSRFVYDKLRQSTLMSDLALVGPLETENIGIEKLVQNVIANPAIRFLIICGKEPHGHQAGQALLALYSRGVDDRGRIVDAEGARPVVNLKAAEVARFRQQVQCIDLRGEESLAVISQTVGQCREQGLTPLSASPVSGDDVPLVMASADIKRALEQDPAGFFIIYVKEGLLVEHYSPIGVLERRITGHSAKDLMDTIIREKWVSRLDHAAYLGRELQKAENCWRSSVAYRQDRDCQ